LPAHLVARVLNDFNAGNLDAFLAAQTLGVGRSRLYQLRTDFLQDKTDFQAGVSGGNHRPPWPEPACQFLEEFLPLQQPPNYQLIADELLRLHGLKRARSSVEAYIKTHLPHLLPSRPKKPRTYRRFRRAHIGELWQHDSSIHQWWPAQSKQLLLLTVDDHSGLHVQGSFVEADTTWNHFLHFRNAFQRWGIPEIIYTDGLSLFGPSSTEDHLDPKSEFQRALRGLNVAHLVAPTPQAKEVRCHRTPSQPEILGRRTPPKRHLAPYSRGFLALIRCPVLFRQEFQFCTVADSQPNSTILDTGKTDSIVCRA
jgi:hypothetical protein